MIFLFRMERKFRLHHKKKMYGAKSLTVSIPRDLVMIAMPFLSPGCNDEDKMVSLPISFSIALCTTGKVESLSSFHHWTKQVGAGISFLSRV